MFVAGLLHDLGMLLLAPFLTRMGEDLTQTAEPVHIAEERLLGISHQEAGGIVAEKWNMKPLVHGVITHHHFKTCPKNYRHAVAVVRLAERRRATGLSVPISLAQAAPGPESVS